MQIQFLPTFASILNLFLNQFKQEWERSEVTEILQKKNFKKSAKSFMHHVSTNMGIDDRVANAAAAMVIGGGGHTHTHTHTHTQTPTQQQQQQMGMSKENSNAERLFEEYKKETLSGKSGSARPSSKSRSKTMGVGGTGGGGGGGGGKRVGLSPGPPMTTASGIGAALPSHPPAMGAMLSAQNQIANTAVSSESYQMQLSITTIVNVENLLVLGIFFCG